MKLNRAGKKLIEQNKTPALTIESALHILDHFLEIELNENQYSALISLLMDIGATPMRNSSALRMVNQGRMFEAVEDFHSWVYLEGKKRTSLVKRRKAEAKLFLTPVIAGGLDVQSAIR